MSDENISTDEWIARAYADPDRLTRIIQDGIREGIMEHKRAGNPVCEWRDNKVVWIQPEDIPDYSKNKSSDED